MEDINMARNKNYQKNNARKETKRAFDRAAEDIEREISNKSGKDTNFRRNEKRRGANDVSWYVPDASMLRDAASFPWLYQMGQAITRQGITGKISDDAVPGIAAMTVNMDYGLSTDPTSPLNASAQAIYTYTRKNNAGSTNYGVPDEMIYIMSLDSVYYMISWITRIYATINMFAMENKYLPQALLDAQHIDVDSIRKDMPGFRSRINNVVLKVANLVIPNNMPIFQRHSFIFNNYYMEGENIRDQIYFFQPQNLYRFEYDASGAGMLKSYRISTFYNSSNLLDADALVNMLDFMVNAIYMEEDFGIMAGDILKAYGENGICKLAMIPDGIIAQPVYNYSVLTQFRNAKFIELAKDLDVTQVIPAGRTSPYLYCSYRPVDLRLGKVIYGTPLGELIAYGQFNESASSLSAEIKDAVKFIMSYSGGDQMIYSDNWDVTPEEVMVGTRLVSTPNVELTTNSAGDTVWEATSLNVGTEIPQFVDYYWNSYTNGVMITNKVTYGIPVVVSYVQTFQQANFSKYDLLNKAGVLSPFKYHPDHKAGTWVGDSTPQLIWSELNEMGIDNYSIINQTHIDRMHTVALLGEFNVPRLAVSRE